VPAFQVITVKYFCPGQNFKPNVGKSQANQGTDRDLDDSTPIFEDKDGALHGIPSAIKILPQKA
jgi:hypothetical protein